MSHHLVMSHNSDDDMAAKDGPLYAYTKKLYDLKEKNDGMSLEQIEKLAEQFSPEIDRSTYAMQLKRMRELDLPRHVVERTAIQFDKFRERGPVFKFESSSKRGGNTVESSMLYDSEYNRKCL